MFENKGLLAYRFSHTMSHNDASNVNFNSDLVAMDYYFVFIYFREASSIKKNGRSILSKKIFSSPK